MHSTYERDGEGQYMPWQILATAIPFYLHLWSWLTENTTWHLPYDALPPYLPYTPQSTNRHASRVSGISGIYQGHIERDFAGVYLDEGARTIKGFTHWAVEVSYNHAWTTDAVSEASTESAFIGKKVDRRIADLYIMCRHIVIATVLEKDLGHGRKLIHAAVVVNDHNSKFSGIA
jgi:hypothetical protein